MLFFPHLCAGCGRDILDTITIDLPALHGPLPHNQVFICMQTILLKKFSGDDCLWLQQPVIFILPRILCLQHLMHQLKYNGKKELGEFFGRQMGNAFLQSNRFRLYRCSCASSLISRRERKRGYNQATVLCEGISETMNLPLLKKVIQRITAYRNSNS